MMSAGSFVKNNEKGTGLRGETIEPRSKDYSLRNVAAKYAIVRRDTLTQGGTVLHRTSAATVAAEACRAPRGRMAVLEKTLAVENVIRAELLKEEHAVRIRLSQEDHDYMMLEREDERKEQRCRLQCNVPHF
ncbi:hypothetical protein MRX96_025421 [Rhipicephalus microplus]